MSGGKGDIDPTWSLLLIILLVLGFAALTWYFFRAELLEVQRWIRMAEIWLVAPFDSRVPDCFTWLRTAPVGTPPPRGSYVMPSPEAYKAALSCFHDYRPQTLDSVRAFEFYNVTPVSLGVISAMITHYLRWPVAVMCGLMGVYAVFFSIRNKFKTRHNMESFIRTQAAMWPVISPIVDFNPSKSSARTPGTMMPDKTPAFAEAFSPEEWLAYHRVPVVNGVPDTEAVRRAMTLQLGPRWRGFSDLPPHALALFAAFALKGAQQREASDELLGKLAKCWSLKNGLQLTPELVAEVKRIVNDPDVGGRALEVANKHAYRTTALLGVLKWARFMGGVLAPAQFLWLRAQERGLWYPLNNLGRRSFLTEGAGAMAHFMAEVAAQKPLLVPRLDTVDKAMKQYVAGNSRTTVVVPSREEPKARRALKTS